MAFEKNKYLEGLRDSLVTGIHPLSYKNGAFKMQITEQTPFIEALNILIASPLPTDEEKCILSKFRGYYTELEESGQKEPSVEKFLPLLESGMKFEELFAKDANARGEIVPQLLVETLKTNGTVWYTEDLIDDDDFGIWRAEYYLRPQARLMQRLNHKLEKGSEKYIIGQFSFSPDFSELSKYTGIMDNAASSKIIKMSKNKTKSNDDNNAASPVKTEKIKPLEDGNNGKGSSSS